MGTGVHDIGFGQEAIRPGLYFVRLRQGSEQKTVRVTVFE